MAHDEQRVRTMAGWIGVEISRSRGRTAGKPGFGLYRVRAAAERHWHVPHSKVGEDGPWTAYAFRLEEIEAAVRNSIEQGRPEGPMELSLVEAGSAAKTGAGGYAGGCTVPTRWTAAYRGRRDLGVGSPVTLKPGVAEEVSALAALVDEGLMAMTHVGTCGCEGTSRLTMACVTATLERSTMRTRQRAASNEFQAEHLERRAYGLRERHAAKLQDSGRQPQRAQDGF